MYHRGSATAVPSLFIDSGATITNEFGPLSTLVAPAVPPPPWAAAILPTFVVAPPAPAPLTRAHFGTFDGEFSYPNIATLAPASGSRFAGASIAVLT